MPQCTKLCLLAFLFIVLIGVGCKKAPTPEPELPVPSTEFWQGADAASLGFNLDSLQLAAVRAASSPSFYALLVIRDDKIALEQYFNGRDAFSPFHLRSITKNFTSALTGIAIDEQLISNLDDKLNIYLPQEAIGDKAEITIRHLLNMTSGLTWDEDAEVLPLINQQIPDPVQTLLERPLYVEAGTNFNYNSVSPHIVSHVISKRSGEPFDHYAKEKLLTPLGVENFFWTRDPNGEVWGGFGLQLRARDLAKFGKLYLDGGMWEGNQLVPAEWVQESSMSQWQLGTSADGYSLQWWTSDAFGSLYYGLGYGGQALMLVPDKNMIIIACQEHFVPDSQHRSQWRHFADDIFPTIYAAAK